MQLTKKMSVSQKVFTKYARSTIYILQKKVRILQNTPSNLPAYRLAQTTDPPKLIVQPQWILRTLLLS